MKFSEHIQLLGMQNERAALEKILSGLSTQYTYEPADKMPTRAESDSDYADEIGTKEINVKRSTVEIAAISRLVHEASRTQRDFEIIGSGRKRLMMACLDATVWRKEKLDRQIYAMEKTDQATEKSA